MLRGYRGKRPVSFMTDCVSADEEYYGTSYADPGRRTKFLVDPMKCDYVKQVILGDPSS